MLLQDGSKKLREAEGLRDETLLAVNGAEAPTATATALLEDCVLGAMRSKD
jgi:hypothetical protein